MGQKVAEKWGKRNHIKFNKEKCKILHLGRNNPRYQYTLEASCLGRSFVDKNLLYSKQTMSQQCTLMAK